jgi:hypothetical protein
MRLRPELCPPAVGPQRIAELATAIETIARLLERGDPADAAIAAFNAETGHHYAAEDFLSYGSSRHVDDFAIEAARPASPKVADVTRDELIEIVSRIQAVDHDTGYCVRLLEADVLHPGVEDLIFHPPPDLVDASPETIVDTALRYRPIAL